MDRLNNLMSTSQWGRALELVKHDARLDQSFKPYLAQQLFLVTAVPEWTPNKLEDVLVLVDDHDWVASAALQVARASDSVAIVTKAVQIGRDAVAQVIASMDDLSQLVDQQDVEGVRELCSLDEAVRRICLIDKTLLEIGDKALTWQELQSVGRSSESRSTQASSAYALDERGDGQNALPNGQDFSTSDPSLSQFSARPIATLALELAASAELATLCRLCARHSRALWSLRTELINSIPEWEEPETYAPLLTGVRDGLETKWDGHPWRNDIDFIEKVFSAGDDDDRRTAQEMADFYRARVERIAELGLISVALALVQQCTALDVPDLEELGEDLSLLSRLAYDRPSAPAAPSNAIQPPIPLVEEQNFTLKEWRSLSPSAIVRAYLEGWSANEVPAAIRRLIVPYLSVLEARLERTGTPDPTISTRLLYEYVLSLPSALPPRLDAVLAVFEASKPTTPVASRIIKSDEDLARLALACIYGCRDNSADAIVHMSKMFECLPAFDVKADSPNLSRSPPPGRTGPRTIFGLHPPGSDLPTPEYLFKALQSFALPLLSTSLDALDLHLAEAETFSRYSVAVPLSWFLASHNDVKAQKAWATRMARTSSSGGGGKAGDEGAFEGEDEWEMLMADMVALTEDAEVDEMRKAFWMLDKEEVLRIFFGGLLAAGRISLAKALLRPSSGEAPLSPQTVQELVISASREFYDNAESGNMHQGDMRLAFECLAAAPQTPEIRRQRDFIEATSRLCSYKLQSHPGIDLTPIEIRLSKDRLAFVGHLLASNEDAYRHPDVVLDLVDKLGYRGDKLAEIRTFAMISDSSLQAGDFDRTAEICDRMVAAVEDIRKAQGEDGEESASKPGSSSRSLVQEAAEYAWRNCFQLGKHEGFDDLDRRLKALGQALILCPVDRISTLLPVWTKLELDVQEQARRKAEEASRAKPVHMLAGLGAPFAFAQGAMPSTSQSVESTLPSQSSQTRPEVPGVATRTINAFFGAGSHRHPDSPGGRRSRQSGSPTRGGGSSSVSGGESPVASPKQPGSSRSRMTVEPGRETHDGSAREGFRAGLSSRFTKGVGWLIGADEELLRREREEAEGML